MNKISLHCLVVQSTGTIVSDMGLIKSPVEVKQVVSMINISI